MHTCACCHWLECQLQSPQMQSWESLARGVPHAAMLRSYVPSRLLSKHHEHSLVRWDQVPPTSMPASTHSLRVATLQSKIRLLVDSLLRVERC